MNPLQLATQAQSFKNSQLANQISQFGLDQKKALGDAYAAATDPTTGKTDFNKLTGILSQSGQPGAAAMPETMANSQAVQTSQQALTQAQFDLGMKHLGAVASIAGGIASNPNAKQSDVWSAVGNAVQNGQIPPQVALQGLADMPGPDAPPGELQKWAARHVAQAAGQAQQLTAMYPNFAQIDTGPNTVGVNVNPVSSFNAGVGTPGFVVKKGIAPATAAQQVSVVSPSGQQGTVPLGNLAVQQRVLSPDQVGGPQDGQGGFGTGRYPQPQQGNGGNPPGFVPTAQPPGAPELAAGGAQRVNAIQQAAGSARNQMHSYDLALEAANKALPGRGSSKLLNPQEIMETLGIGSQATGDRVKDTQILNSQLASAADQAAAALGLAGSDARLQAAKAGQPNGEMNGPALVQQIKYVKGLQQGVLDKQSAVQNYLAQNGNNTANLGQFETQFNKSFNPDVSYIRSLSNPADQQAEIAKLKKDGKYQDWRKSYVEMKEMGAF